MTLGVEFLSMEFWRAGTPLSRVLSVAIVLLVIASSVAFFVQETRANSAEGCRVALLKVIVARAQANEEERLAHRLLVDAMSSYSPSSELVESRRVEWKRVSARADARRAGDGSLQLPSSSCDTTR